MHQFIDALSYELQHPQWAVSISCIGLRKGPAPNLRGCVQSYEYGKAINQVVNMKGQKKLERKK